jgi:hypothetical protein
LANRVSVLKLCKDVKSLPYANSRILLLNFHSDLVGEATRLLEQMIHNDPKAEVAVAGRIVQGDMLHAMSDFNNAQLAHEYPLNFVSNAADLRHLSLFRVKRLTALQTAISVLENRCSNSAQSTSFRGEYAAEYCLALKLHGKYGNLSKFVFDLLAKVDDSGVELTKISRLVASNFVHFTRCVPRVSWGRETH